MYILGARNLYFSADVFIIAKSTRSCVVCHLQLALGKNAQGLLVTRLVVVAFPKDKSAALLTY